MAVATLKSGYVRGWSFSHVKFRPVPLCPGRSLGILFDPLVRSEEKSLRHTSACLKQTSLNNMFVNSVHAGSAGTVKGLSGCTTCEMGNDPSRRRWQRHKKRRPRCWQKGHTSFRRFMMVNRFFCLFSCVCVCVVHFLNCKARRR